MKRGVEDATPYGIPQSIHKFLILFLSKYLDRRSNLFYDIVTIKEWRNPNVSDI